MYKNSNSRVPVQGPCSNGGRWDTELCSLRVACHVICKDQQWVPFAALTLSGDYFSLIRYAQKGSSEREVNLHLHSLLCLYKFIYTYHPPWQAKCTFKLFRTSLIVFTEWEFSSIFFLEPGELTTRLRGVSMLSRWFCLAPTFASVPLSFTLLPGSVSSLPQLLFLCLMQGARAEEFCILGWHPSSW